MSFHMKLELRSISKDLFTLLAFDLICVCMPTSDMKHHVSFLTNWIESREINAVLSIFALNSIIIFVG
jgi:hypothetical protein